MNLTAKVKENRLEVGNWFIYINLSMSRVEVTHKVENWKFAKYTLEEAIQEIKCFPENCGHKEIKGAV